MTAGRTPASGVLEPMVLERPVIRQVMDWNDVDWAALSMQQRLAVCYDIVVGKTLDEWREEWAIAKAEGFGLKGLSTLLLAATVIVCAAYSILALTTTTGGAMVRWRSVGVARCGAERNLAQQAWWALLRR